MIELWITTELDARLDIGNEIKGVGACCVELSGNFDLALLNPQVAGEVFMANRIITTHGIHGLQRTSVPAPTLDFRSLIEFVIGEPSEVAMSEIVHSNFRIARSLSEHFQESDVNGRLHRIFKWRMEWIPFLRNAWADLNSTWIASTTTYGINVT